MRVSIQAFSNLFSNYNFTLYSSSCDKNCLTLSIFISVLLFLFLLWWWLLLLLILLFYVLVLNTRNVAKFGFVTLDITKKNSLYWILNVEIYLDAMDIEIPLNKEIKHLSNMTKILWKEISQILWIYFMPMYGWLDKAIKLLMKNHEIRLICSIPRSECNAFVWLNKAMNFW